MREKCFIDETVVSNAFDEFIDSRIPDLCANETNKLLSRWQKRVVYNGGY